MILCVLLFFGGMKAQTINISGSCVANTGALVQSGDATTPTYNGRPVYYNGSLAVNYSGSAITVPTYLYYALAAELGTVENRWVVTYDGQPFYYFVSDATTAPLGSYSPFDTGAATNLCGGPVIISTPCIAPTAYAVTGGGNYCLGAPGVGVGLANSETGIAYQLYLNAVALGTAVSGTGAAISFGNQTGEGIYTVIGTRTVGGCLTTMTGSVSVGINPSATADAGGAIAAICQSGTTGALGGSFGGAATSAVWSDGAAGGTFTNNGGSTPNTATYTAAPNAPASVTLTLTTSGGLCGAAVASKVLSITTGTLYYTDADGDGYDNGSPRVVSCVALPGYVLTTLGTDCNDTNAEVNPNHVEVLGNGTDDNCDGTIDEVAPTSSIQPTQCGVTLINLAQAIYANVIYPTPAQGYRFEVTNGVTVRTYDSATNSFNLLNLAGGATYNTTYSIRVAVKTGGFWRAYSAVCTVSTPVVPTTTKVAAAQCGVTLATISSTIYCGAVASASGYRFRINDGINPARTFDTTVNRFSLTDVAGGAAFATTYAVDVQLRFGATWESTWGQACNISTPLTPGTSNLSAAQCGINITNLWQTLYASQIAVATGYRFEVTKSGGSTVLYDTPNPRFSLKNITTPGFTTSNASYSIRVAILYNGNYLPFGAACIVTTNGAARMTNSPISVFEVKVYPNPFASSFSIDVNTSSDSNVTLKVYDMIGRILETKVLSVNDFTALELGTNYPSGVYNAIVTQGENVKTLRVVKR